MKYKLILLDLDGTLIDSSRIISDKVKRTINKARNKIAISMVSSRDEEEVLKYVKELNLNNYHIVEGARLIDTKGKEIWHRYLSPSKTKEILNLLKPCNLEIVVFADGKVCKDNFEKLKKVTLIILQHFLWSEALKWEKFLKRIKGVSVLIVHSSSIPNVWNVLVSHKHGTKRHAAKNGL